MEEFITETKPNQKQKHLEKRYLLPQNNNISVIIISFSYYHKISSNKQFNIIILKAQQN